jgi:hypothetical protein
MILSLISAYSPLVVSFFKVSSPQIVLAACRLDSGYATKTMRCKSRSSSVEFDFELYSHLWNEVHWNIAAQRWHCSQYVSVYGEVTLGM